MSPNDRERVESLCLQALSKDAPDRAAFLDAACGADAALRREVESILAARSEAGEFLEAPPWAAGAAPLEPGTRLGPYEIDALIGAGGMGEVYKARDTRLGRAVAIKVLPAEWATNPDRLRRFEQEARAVAALSHPNILDIHDFGSHQERPYIVMELLEGETLADRLRRGGLTIAHTLEMGEQIATGLAAAHDKGVIHRDLKPSNVFLTTDARVKVVDFGIAKVTHPESASAATAGAAFPSTGAGAVLGTVGYMAPEQIRGLPSDARMDIFALGCLLYEMASGKRAFHGNTPVDTMAAILSSEPPPLSSDTEPVPPALDAIVRRCLQKQPDDRFARARDVASALRDVRVRTDQPAQAASLPVTPTSVRDRARALVRPIVVVPLLLLLTVGTVLSVQQVRRRQNMTWARTTAIPEILRLAEQQENVLAFKLAQQVDARIAGNQLLGDIWPRIAAEVRMNVTPKGADVAVRGHKDENTGWVHLGSANGEPMRVPRGWWAFRFDYLGYETVEATLSDEMTAYFPVDLPRIASAPSGMVRVALPGNQADFFVNFFNYQRPQSATIEPFLLDRYEVTNADFKRFVDAGGYKRPEFWKETFVKDGRLLTWDGAMSLFRDPTGRPGPATWELGSFPDGQGEYPVTGVSWYEASAYAAFAGKRLPTVYHWDVASGIYASGNVIPGSNFSGKIEHVGASTDSLNTKGLYDMAGNAREWCSNATGELRFTLGGAADGPTYFYLMPEPRPPFDRAPMNGFRCMLSGTPGAAPAELEQPISRRPRPAPDRASLMDDAAWATWLRFLSNAGPTTALNAKTELVADDSPWWRMEKVSFAAAYEGDRVVAYLFLPKQTRPPYQTVVYWGPANDWFTPSSDDGRNLSFPATWDYLVKAGRAVIYPILKGTFERRGTYLDGKEGIFDARDKIWHSMELTLMGARDVFRSIDYLATRPDIDISRIAMMGFSSGAYYAPLPCAVDPRIKTCTLVCGGSPYPEVLGWARRVTIPVLMINGLYDTVLPPLESQQPLFDALGTRAADKRHALFPTDHALSGYRPAMMKEHLAWLDRYLGKVG